MIELVTDTPQATDDTEPPLITLMRLGRFAEAREIVEREIAVLEDLQRTIEILLVPGRPAVIDDQAVAGLRQHITQLHEDAIAKNRKIVASIGLSERHTAEIHRVQTSMVRCMNRIRNERFATAEFVSATDLEAMRVRDFPKEERNIRAAAKRERWSYRVVTRKGQEAREYEIAKLPPARRDAIRKWQRWETPYNLE